MSPTTTATEYGLYIFSPGSDQDRLAEYSSPTPFGSIAVGDIVDEVNGHLRPGKGLRVTGRVHRLHERNDGSVLHMTALMTEEVDLLR